MVSVPLWFLVVALFVPYGFGYIGGKQSAKYELLALKLKYDSTTKGER